MFDYTSLLSTDDISIYAILPDSIKQDKNIAALARALDAEWQNLCAAVHQVLLLPRLDNLPDTVLDHLAWHFHVDFYSSTFPAATKRNLIRNSILWHRLKGTPYAVRKILEPFLGKVTVEENWLYGGEPYFFKLIVSGLRDLGDEGELLLQLIDDAKNVRSWLEALTFDLTFDEAEIYHCAFAEDIGGDEVIDIATMPVQNERLFAAFAEAEAGFEVVDFCDDYPVNHGIVYYGIADLEGGEVIIDSNYFPADDDFSFAELIRRKWEEFKKNPVIDYYSDDDDVESFPMESNFLRLYFGFDDNHVRYLTFLNPKDKIAGSEIKSLGNFAADNFVLTNAFGAKVTGIKRALLVNKSVEEVI